MDGWMSGWVDGREDSEETDSASRHKGIRRKRSNTKLSGSRQEADHLAHLSRATSCRVTWTGPGTSFRHPACQSPCTFLPPRSPKNRSTGRL